MEFTGDVNFEFCVSYEPFLSFENDPSSHQNYSRHLDFIIKTGSKILTVFFVYF